DAGAGADIGRYEGKRVASRLAHAQRFGRGGGEGHCRQDCRGEKERTGRVARASAPVGREQWRSGHVTDGTYGLPPLPTGEREPIELVARDVIQNGRP